MPQGRQRAGRHRQPDGDRALDARRHRLGRCRRAPGRRSPAPARDGEPALIGIGSSPRRLATIGQPVSVCHQWSTTGMPSSVGRPVVGVRVEPLAGQEERTSGWTGRTPAIRSPSRILLLDRPERGRRGEQHLDAVLGDDPPERAGVGRADRLALVEHGGGAGEQRARRRCRSGRRPSRHRMPSTTTSPGPTSYTFVIDQRMATAWPPLSRTMPLGFPVVPEV